MATLKSMLSQLETQIKNRNWTGSSNVVFNANSVLVSRFVVTEHLRTLIVPICIIMPGNIVSDPQYDVAPDLWRVDITVRIIVAIPGDAVGRNVLMGANRQANKSEGAGVMDVIQEVYNAIGFLNVSDNANFSLQFRQKGGSGGIHIEERVFWEYSDFLFEGWVTAV